MLEEIEVRERRDDGLESQEVRPSPDRLRTLPAVGGGGVMGSGSPPCPSEAEPPPPSGACTLYPVPPEAEPPPSGAWRARMGADCVGRGAEVEAAACTLGPVDPAACTLDPAALEVGATG